MAEISGHQASIGNWASLDSTSSWSIDYSADVHDVSEFSMSPTNARKFIAGLSEWSGSVDVFIDDSSAPPSAGDTVSGAQFYFNDTDYISGDIIVTSVSFDVSVDDAETYSVDFQGTGKLTYSIS